MNTGSVFQKGSHKSQYVTFIFGLQKSRISKRKIKGIFKAFLGAPRQFLSDSQAELQFQSDRPLRRAKYKWCFRGGMEFKTFRIEFAEQYSQCHATWRESISNKQSNICFH